jgi:probable rRNA maturation factor
LETISFHNNGISPKIRHKKESKDFLVSIFKNENVPFKSISYIFCRDQYLLALNQKYLRHDTLTDVLTFTLSDKAPAIVSEIYISVERVKENAISLKCDYQHELFRIMIHGILHLCGYKDHSPAERTIMRKKEAYYLSLLPFHVKRST